MFWSSQVYAYFMLRRKNINKEFRKANVAAHHLRNWYEAISKNEFKYIVKNGLQMESFQDSGFPESSIL